MFRKFSRKQKRLAALALAVAMLITGLAVGLSGTFASKPAVTGDFTAAANSYPKIGVGQTTPYVIPGAAYASSSNPAVASVPAPLNGQPLTGALNITGVSAGTAVVSVGSTMGLVMGMPVQVFDNNNIVKYQIPNGGEVFFSAPGKTAASPVTVETTTNTTSANAAAFNAIAWESLQPDVATVNASGGITSVAKGVAVILGRFTDKWGVRQTMIVLVGVELNLDGEPPIPLADHLIINQAYGTGPLDGSGSVSHSFVELYNPTAAAISLAGCSLQIQNGSDASNAATEWVKYDFSGGTVAPHGSFLIRMDVTSPLTTVRYIIPIADVDWTGGRIMSNRAYSVALVRNQTLLSKNITAGEMDAVIDLVGATNTSPQDTTLNYLGTPVDDMSKQKPIRRVDFRDTGDNRADFEVLDYRATGLGNGRLEEVRPRWSGDGAWGAGGSGMVKQGVSYQISTGNDDLHATGAAVTLAGTSLQLSGMSGTASVTNYLRFPGVDLPPDAVVTNAYIAFTARAASINSTNFTVRGELGAGAPFTSNISSVNGRSFTSAFAANQTPYNVAVGDVFQTGDLSAVVKEMRDHYGGGAQDYVFQLEGSKTGAFAAQTYEGSQSAAPKLFIEYSSAYGQCIASGNINDCAEEYGTAHAITLDARLRIGGYRAASLTAANKQVTGLRFPGVAIPADAEITDAYMEFTIDAVAAAGVISNMVVRAEQGNAGAYTAAAYNISERAYGTLSVRYQQPAFLTRLETVRTANLKGIIDESRLNGWQSGQALAFMVDGDNYIGSVYQFAHTYPPRLVVQYTLSGRGPFIEGAITEAALMANIFINEVSAEGTKASKESWVELYNANDVPVVLGKGTYLSNSSSLTSFQFGGLLIPAKGFRVVYCDGFTDQGKDHANFALKSSGTVTLAAADAKGAVKAIDSLTYGSHLYNQTYGRTQDGGAQAALFQNESFGASNSLGQLNYQVSVSRDRGVYDTGFTLTITTSRPGAVIKYSVDGVTTPDPAKGLIYTGSIALTKSCVVKIYAYDNAGNSGLQAYTYIFKDNLTNEVTSGAQWAYKSSINSSEYAKAMSCFPIVSITTDSGSNLSSSTTAGYVQSTVEYIDDHLGKGNNNHFSVAGAKKFGQVSITQYNSGVSFKYHRDYGTKKSKNRYFEPIPFDKFPTPLKYGQMQLKEGQDGPQSDIYNLGYLRYSDSVAHTLGIQMGKFDLKTRYVQYFFNGKYYGLKTLRESFSDGMFENYFGDESGNYTKINFQDGYYPTGTVLSGDGSAAPLTAIQKAATEKNFQEFKKYVDVNDYIKYQILFMFIDCETEAEAILHNSASSGGGVKLITNINDLDGAFFNNGMTGTAGYSYAGGGGTYRYKWTLSVCRRGPGGWFGTFSGDSTAAAAGNLEFRTLVKDQVLAQIGPAGGTWAGAPGAPLSVANVNGLILENFNQLNNNFAYKVDAAYMGARSGIYQDWLNMQGKVQSQMPDRVKYSLERWLAYGMAHTLEPVTFSPSGSGVTLANPNSGADVYYTTNGSDPMGPDGVISGAAVKYAAGTVLPGAAKLTARPYAANNWGPVASR